MLGTKEKEIIVVIIVLVVVLFALSIFFGGYFDGKVGNGPDTSTEVGVESGDFEDLSAGEVQASFPADFPFEEGAGITNNYKYKLNNTDNEQFTLEYESEMTVAENFSLFREYLTQNNYSITNEMSKENVAFLYGRAEGGDLSILIEAKRGTVVISASYLNR